VKVERAPLDPFVFFGLYRQILPNEAARCFSALESVALTAYRRINMESTFEWHQQNPDISLDAYVKARRVLLGESLSAKKLIYLDTNYWISLWQ
jgi:hypothetical protein